MHNTSEFLKKHPKFDFAAYIDLLKRDLAGGEVYEIVFGGLCDHAHEHATELIEEFRVQSVRETEVKYTLLEILAQAKVSDAFHLFVEHLNSLDWRIRGWAEFGLKRLDTKQARRVLFENDRESRSKKL